MPPLRSALVAMPFASARHPSLQLGVLQAAARRRGLLVDTLPLNLDLAREIGLEDYERLCRYRGRLLGDWLYSVEAFGGAAPDPAGRFLEEYGDELGRQLAGGALDPARLAAIRAEAVPRHLDRLVEAVPWREFGVVGLTTTFQQAVPSIALARRIKALHPSVVTVLGGAACEGEMGLELLRAASCVDCVVVGEGDETFPELVEAVAAGHDPAAVAGVAARRDGAVTRPAPRAPVRLDELPVPSFEDWFRRAAMLGLLPAGGRRDVAIPFEAARGCWWGRCLFCGVAGERRAFRAKSADRVIAEIDALAREEGSLRLESADLVLGPEHAREVLGELARRELDYELFWECRAGLAKDDLRRMARAGVTRIQPGIESLSTRTLRLMRKGTTALENVNLLRWALHLGIDASWNVLWGFPGEAAEDTAAQAELMRRLFHLQPPQGGARIWLERFSPLFVERERFRFRSLAPEASHRHVWPAGTDLDRLAYFFDYALEDALPDEAFEETSAVIARWIGAWGRDPRPRLTLRRGGGFVEIEDARDPSTPGTYTFEGALAALYLACSDAPRSPEALLPIVGPGGDPAEVRACLDEFCALRLMAEDGGEYLSLAVPQRRP
jgi:ribosomal peptide maturation radical SAM protein 1